jgi:hypothetical protein
LCACIYGCRVRVRQATDGHQSSAGRLFAFRGNELAVVTIARLGVSGAELDDGPTTFAASDGAKVPSPTTTSQLPTPVSAWVLADAAVVERCSDSLFETDGSEPLGDAVFVPSALPHATEKDKRGPRMRNAVSSLSISLFDNRDW